jgi:hypothetical protein
MLVGARFNTPFYAKALPEDWKIKITSDPFEELKKFWEVTNEYKFGSGRISLNVI